MNEKLERQDEVTADGADRALIARATGRREWELAEQVAELETKLTELTERERTRELEVAALRSEIQLRLAYNASLEETAHERQVHVDWLMAHLDQITAELSASSQQREAFMHALEATSATLVAERNRISYRVSNAIVQLLFPLRLLRRKAAKKDD